MTAIIDGVSVIGPLGPTREMSPMGDPGQANAAEGFSSVLASALDQANQLDHAAATQASRFASGAVDDIHGTLIASREADIAVHLVGSIRNKLIDAFHELWHTSL